MDLRTLDRESVVVWPSLEEKWLGDWKLRFGGGVYGRSNSVQPFGDPGVDLDAAIATCEKDYRDAGTRPMFRLPDCFENAPLENALVERGYEVGDPTEVRFGPIGSHDPQPGVTIAGKFDDAWFEAYLAGSGRAHGRENVARRLLEKVDHPRAFARIDLDGKVASVGLGAVHNGTMWMFGIATEPAHRGRGLATRLVSALLAWGGSAGAARSALQVMSTNVAAIRLYDNLDFRVAYGYHYRRL